MKRILFILIFSVSIFSAPDPAVSAAMFKNTGASGAVAVPQSRKTSGLISDEVPPVITLMGNRSDTVTAGAGTYHDPGFTAADIVEGVITSQVVVSEIHGNPLPLSLASPGHYTLIYKVSNRLGDQTTAMRDVYIIGSTMIQRKAMGFSSRQNPCGNTVFSLAGRRVPASAAGAAVIQGEKIKANINPLRNKK